MQGTLGGVKDGGPGGDGPADPPDASSHLAAGPHTSQRIVSSAPCRPSEAAATRIRPPAPARPRTIASALPLNARRSGEGKAVMSVGDRKSTRLNSSHVAISYAVFCLKKKTTRA